MSEGGENSNIAALASLLDAKGLDAGDFIDVINALATIKKRDADKDAKEEQNPRRKKRRFLLIKSLSMRLELMSLSIAMAEQNQVDITLGSMIRERRELIARV